MSEPTILFQDSDIVILDKPSGLLVHSIEGKDSKEETLADWLLKTFPVVEGIGEEGRWGIVHRLDRDTSGIMVAALSDSSYVRLKKQFAHREVHKTYRAFVYGAMKEERGTIERAIGRSATGNRTAKLKALFRSPMSVIQAPASRESSTTFKTLERSALASYLELYPKTGRTHQIRVHLSLMQHPVVCDSRYAPGRPAILGFNRLALHSYKIAFTHPSSGKEISFEAQLPQDFVVAKLNLKGELPE